MTCARPVHAFGDDALGTGDATEVAAHIRSGEVSAAEVREAALRRAERVQPLLHAVECTDPAPAPGLVGPFAGVPTYIKDNVDVAGLPTTQGSGAFTARPAGADSPVVTQLRTLGLDVLGKSRMPEFGLNASTEFADAPPVRNPWHPGHSAGASSGGAAALVAAGVVPLAHGNDGGGSLRIPAAACGLVGLKPSRGRLVADPDDSKLPVRIVAQGVLTRSVRDTAGYFAAAEAVRRARALPPVRRVTGPSRTRLRIGLVLDSVTGTPTDDETRAAVQETATLLEELGHHVEEVRPPGGQQFVEDFSLYWGMLGFLICRTGRLAFGRDFDVDRTEDLTRGLADMCRRRLRQLPGAVRRLRRSTRDYRALFATSDVLLSPVLAHTAPPLGELAPTLPFEELFPRIQSYVGFTPLSNAAGGPALALPVGRSRAGLPIGAHLSADVGDERTLLELGFELEEARPWPRADQVEPLPAGRPDA
ncbi:MAG: amidase [Nocardioidaceae bacterium]